jgi:predicted dehydrogenase
MSRSLTRRRFLQEGAALTASAAWLVQTRGAEPKAPPSERVNVGVIGVDGQGAYNLGNVARQNFVNIVALCDVNIPRAAEARKTFPRATFQQDYRKLLDQKDIDAVVVATPDHMHAFPALQAMQAGKHVYCEKPLAHSVHEIRLMMETAAKNKLVTQMGTQIHAGDNYRRVVEIVRAGTIGPIRRVQVWCAKRPDERHLAKTPPPVPEGLDYDLWLGPAPYRPYDPAFVVFHWRWWWDFGGGILADMACHYMDLPHWALDLRTPATVSASGRKVGAGDHDVPDLLQADFHYAARGDLPAVDLTWYSGVPGPELTADKDFRGFGSGVLFTGEKGQLVADYDRYLLLPESDFKDFKPPKPSIPSSVGHHKEWLEAVRTGGTTTCNFAYSGALAETVLLGNVAFRSGQKIEWDDKAGKVTNSSEADKFLRREYRKGWQL